MKTKKLFALLLTILMVVSITVPLIVNAIGDTIFTVSEAQGEIGDNVSVSVSISADSGMAAATIVLNYDNTVLDLVSAVKGAGLTDGIADVMSDEVQGTITLTYINMDGFNGSGSIIDATFNILGTATGIIPLTLEVPEFLDVNSNTLGFNITQGSVEVIEPVSSEAVSSEPASSEAVSSEPASSEAVSSEPVSSEAVSSEPASSEAVSSEPASSEAVSSEPVSSESVSSEPASSEAVSSEPASSEAVSSEPASSQPSASSTGGTGGTGGTSSSAGGNGNPSTSDVGIILALAGIATSGIIIKTARKRK